MKISLIYPPLVFPFKNLFVYSHCIGLRSLSSFLKMEGKHEVNFIDSLMLGFSNVKQYANGFIVGLETDEIASNIPADTELVGVSVPFSLIAPIAHDIVESVKARLPHVIVVMGGVYPSTQPRLALTSKADYIIVGEGETAMKELTDGIDPRNIQGVYSRDSFGKEFFPPANMIEDLDSLPFPDYSIPMMDKYFDHSPRNVIGRTASLHTSRGCPFYCEFCSIHPVYGRKWRGRSAENVLSEIEYLVNTHSITSLEIEDDNFTLKKNRTIEILEGIIGLNKKGANLNWRTPNGVRMDTLDEEVIVLIKKANCSSIILALEHGDQEMIRTMDKNLDLDKAFNVIQLLVKHGVSNITIFLIVGYPGETQERFQNSVKYLKKIRALGDNITVCVNIAQPYPGTKLLARCIAEGYIKDKDFDNFLKRRDFTSSRHFVAVTTPDFDTEEVLHRKETLEKIFM